VGRTDELAAARRRIAFGECRLVTLTGPGGSGQTRLAIEIGAAVEQDLPGGAWFVPLATTRDPGLVLAALADCLGVSTAGEDELWAGLTTRLALPTLVVLDNLEHLRDVAPTIARLLERVSSLRVLVTSRAPLRIRGERVVELQPLTSADAMRLFVQRAADVGSDLEPSSDLAELCDRLDRLPLAIEIAAPRARLMSPAQLLARISDVLDASGARDAWTAHSSLAAMITWSYDLLTVAERELFRALGIFADGCTLEAAEQVCAADAETLLGLIDQSLLQRRDTPGGIRFGMLESVHRYARRLLEATREVEQLSASHFEYHARLAQQFAESEADDMSRWLDRLDAERADVRQALEWASGHGLVGRAVEVYDAIREYTRARGRISDEQALIELMLASDGLSVDDRTRLLHEQVVLLTRQGELDRADLQGQVMLELARAGGDQARLTMAALTMAMVARERGDERAEAAYAEEMLAAAKRSGQPRMEIVSVAHVALRSLHRGDYATAVLQYDDLVQRMSTVEVMRVSIATAILNRGLAELHADRPSDAAASLAAAAELARELGDLDMLGYVYEAYAALAIGCGDAAAAARLQGAAVTALETAGTVLEAFEAGMRSRTEAAARSSLGESEYRAAFAEGRELEIDEVLRIAAGIGTGAQSG
jgi:predicted ATPase